MTKRLMCIIISVLMIVSLLPTGAFADSSGSTDGTVTVTADSTTDAPGSAEETTESVGEEVSVEAANAGETYVASVGDTSYESIADAFSAANSTSGSTITLLANATASASWTVSGTVTLDLAGHTLNMGSSQIIIKNSASLTVNDTGNGGGAVTSSQTVGVVSVQGGTLTVNGGTINSTGAYTNGWGYAAVAVYGSTSSADTNYSTVTVNSGATLKTESGDSTKPGYGVAVYYYSNATSYECYGVTVNIYGTCTDAYLYVNGSITSSSSSVTFNISNATITGQYGIYAAGYATWNISNTTITGVASAIEIRAGVLNVSSSTLTATSDSTNVITNWSGATVTGAAIAVSQHSTDQAVTVSVTNSTVKGYYGVLEVNKNSSSTAAVSVTIGVSSTVQSTNASGASVYSSTSSSESYSTSMSITGGTYLTSTGSADTSVNSYVAEGLTLDDSGSVVTDTTTYVAQIGDTKYETLADAIAAVPVGTSADNLGAATTITILCDIDDAEGISIPSYVNLTIDFNNTTYTLTGPGAGSTGTETIGFQLLKDSTIVMKNGTIKIAENANNIKRIIQNYSNLTLQGMQIYSENQVGGENYCLSFLAGSITFSGNTSIISSESAGSSVIAFDIDHASSTAMYYSSVSVTFDSTYSGTISGQIVYDTKDVDLASLTIEASGTGTFSGGIVLSSTTSALEADPNITISSGTFGNDVSEYCTSTTTALALSSDGTYTVVDCWDVSADDGTSSVKAYATVESDGKVTLHIIGTGAMKDYSAASERPWHLSFITVNGGTTTYSKEDVTAVEIEDGVTQIGAYAFASLMISHAIIPSSVKTISANAFSAARPGTGSDGNYLPVIVYMVGNTSYTPNSTTSEGNVILAYLNGGSLDDVTDWSTDGTLATPTLEGDTFEGWYRSSNFSGDKLGDEEAATKGKVYYAKYTGESSWDVSADDGESSVLAYVTLNNDGSTVTLHITGNGAMKDFDANTDRPWHSGFTVSGASGTFAKESITNIVIDEGVTHIGALAFCSTKVSSVVIPASVESIGENAFAWVKGYTADNTNYLTIVYLEGDTDWTLSSGETAYVAQAYLNGTSLPNDYTVTSTTLPETTLTDYTVMGWYTDTSASGDKFTTAVAGNTYYACVAVASITSGETTTYYTSLSAAISAAGNDDTITLLADVTLTANGNFSSELKVASNSTVSIDLNGHDINCGSITYPIYVASGATLNISDSSSTSTVEQGTIFVAGTYGIYCEGTLNISGGNVSSSSSNVAVYIYSGKITMTGGSISTSSPYGLYLYQATAASLSDCTITTSYSSWGYAVYCHSCTGKVSMSNVTIDADGTYNCGLALLSYTEAELTNCNIHTEYWYCIANNGADSEVKLTISGGTYTADDCTVLYLPNVNATTAISNATITGSCGIEIRGGTLTLTDCTVTGTNSSYIWQSNGSGNTVYGPAIAISQHTTKGNISVTINGGTYSATNAPAVVQKNLNSGSSDDVSKISLSITSGTFTGYSSESDTSTAIELESVSDGMNSSISGGNYSSQVDPSYCADGYAPTLTTVGETEYYGVVNAVATGYLSGKYVAYYTDISSALNSIASEVDTIKLADDVPVSEALTASTTGTHTLDLNGYDLTISSGATLTISSGVTIVIEDSASEGKVSNAGTIEVSGTLDIRDLDYTADGEGNGLVGKAGGKISLASTGTFIVPDAWATEWSASLGEWTPNWSSATSGSGIFSSAAEGAMVYCNGTGYKCTTAFESTSYDSETTYWNGSSTYLVEYYKHSAAESEDNTWSYPVSSNSNEIFAGWYDSEGNVYTGTTGVATAKFVKLFLDNTTNSTNEAAAVINFIGGSLRKDSEGTSSTSLRFGYEIIIPEDFDSVSWKWTWSSSDGSGTVNGQYYSSTTALSNTEIGSTVIRTNLVLTGIPSTSYTTSISSTLIVTLVTGDGTTVTITGSASSRSVYNVAYSIANDSTLDDGDSNKTYASSILSACSGS